MHFIASHHDAVAESEDFVGHVIVHRTGAPEQLLADECDTGTAFETASAAEQHTDLGAEEAAIGELDLNAAREPGVLGVDVEARILTAEHRALAFVVPEELYGHSLDVVPTGRFSEGSQGLQSEDHPAFDLLDVFELVRHSDGRVVCACKNLIWIHFGLRRALLSCTNDGESRQRDDRHNQQGRGDPRQDLFAVQSHRIPRLRGLLLVSRPEGGHREVTPIARNRLYLFATSASGLSFLSCFNCTLIASAIVVDIAPGSIWAPPSGSEGSRRSLRNARDPSL